MLIVLFGKLGALEKIPFMENAVIPIIRAFCAKSFVLFLALVVSSF